MPAMSWAELRANRQSRYNRNGDVTVTNAAGGSEVLPHNPRRIAFVIVNNEANAAHVTRGGHVPTTTTGVRLDAAGGALQQTLEDDGTVVQQAVRVILETAAGVVYVEEIEEA